MVELAHCRNDSDTWNKNTSVESSQITQKPAATAAAEYVQPLDLSISNRRIARVLRNRRQEDLLYPRTISPFVLRPL